MIATERRTYPVRAKRSEQIKLNKENGDRTSFDGGMWHSYGSSIDKYSSTFRSVLRGEQIEDLLKGKESVTVIDLMSPSEAIASLLQRIPAKEKFGIALSLEDQRTDFQKERDSKLGIRQIAEDIMKLSTWDGINRELGGRKADLIMERALYGLYCVSMDSKLYAVLLNKVWNMLEENGGILLFQAPNPVDIGGQWVGPWTNLLHSKGIDVVSDMGDFFCPYPILKIVKTPNSPEKLPFLA